MRKVVDARQVCHLWANQSQDEARTATGNLYFTGPTLYSYGSHFVIAAHLDNGLVLWNDESYSNTTSKQKSRAWWALSRTKQASAISVHTLNQNLVRNLEYVRSCGDGKRLPDLVTALASAIVSTVQSMAKMREGKGPEQSAFHKIKSHEKAGQALCAYVAKGKRAPKWPLPALPEVMPTGEARQAFIVSIANGQLLAEHESALAQALHSIAEIAADSATPFDPMNGRIQNYRGALDGAGRNLNTAARAYEVATGKKSAKVAKAWKAHAQASAQALPYADRWALERARHDAKNLTREAFRMFRRAKGGKVSHPLGRNAPGYIASRLIAEMRALPKDESEAYQPLINRLLACEAWLQAEANLDRAREDFQGAVSCGVTWPKDAVRMFTDAVTKARAAAKVPAFAALHADELGNILTTATALVAEYKAAAALKHAAAVDDWKAGAAISLPYGAGTFARIKGNVMQTSRGASVPLSHACRLARVAKRVIAAGGRTWAPGEGPRVGGFQVNSIAADGAAVIGCHEFDAVESARLLALLEACAECHNIADDTHEA